MWTEELVTRSADWKGQMLPKGSVAGVPGSTKALGARVG